MLGRSILDAVELNTSNLSATAADWFDGNEDAERLVRWIAGHNAGIVSRVMEGVFHANEGEKVEEIDVNSE